MAEFPVRIPKVSLATTEATVVEWLVDDDQRVEEGQPLYVMETDKVEQEIEAPAAGAVHWKAEIGETYEVGSQIGYIETGT